MVKNNTTKCDLTDLTRTDYFCKQQSTDQITTDLQQNIDQTKFNLLKTNWMQYQSKAFT